MVPRPPSLPVHHLGSNAPTGLRVAVQRFNQDHPTRSMSAHQHGFFELMYLEAGGGVHFVNGAELPTTAGDLYLLAPGDVHDVSRLTTAHGWVIVFEPEAIGVSELRARVSLPGELLLLSFMRPLDDMAVRLRVPVERRGWWTGLTSSLQEELRAPQLGHADAVRWSLSLLLLETARLAERHLPRLSLADRPLLERVFAFIETHFRDPISLQDVVQAAGRSRSHVTKVVRQETGRSVVAWIKARRLTEARLLLLQSELSIEQIALASGFSDMSYFSRVFRRQHGVSPRRWREARRP